MFIKWASFSDLFILYQQGIYDSIYDISTTIIDKFHNENLWHHWFVLNYGLEYVNEAYGIVHDEPNILFAMRIYYDIVHNNGVWYMVSDSGNVKIYGGKYNIIYECVDGIFKVDNRNKRDNIRNIYDYFMIRGYTVYLN